MSARALPYDDLSARDRHYSGVQRGLSITAAPNGAEALVNKPLLEAGQLSVAGVYECAVRTSGLSAADFHLMPSQFAGTAFAPSVALTYANGRKTKTPVAGANFAAGTLQKLSLTGINGEQIAILSFTLPAATTITFDPAAGGADKTGPTPAAVAEYNGK